MPDGSILRLATLNAVVDLALAHLDGGCHTVIVGACGTGTTAVCEIVQEALTRRGVPLYSLDCVNAGSNFPLFLKAAAKEFTAPRNYGHNVLLIDHASSLKPPQLTLLLKALAKIPPKNLTNFLWIGNLDARGLDPEFQPRIHSVPRSHICFPDLGRDELLRVHARIVTGVDTRWGEAMHYFALDWCGHDLALVHGLAEFFYGEWDRNIYDDSVSDRLERWLKSDPLVARYRERLKALPTECKAHLDLLDRGGKLRLRPEINEEPDRAIRQLFLEGFLAPNLLSGFYQLRNLLVRYLLNESAAGGRSLPPIALLRRSTNERVASVLQDAEISLRMLLMKTLRGLTITGVKELLSGKKTEKRLFEPEFKKKVLDWANAQIDEVKRDELSRFLSEQGKAYDSTHTLWDKVCVLYREHRGETTGEPTPAEVADYLTFNELADALITLADRIFTKRDPFKTDAEQPAKRWQGYLSTMRRLRNHTAHLRNVGFQELEDLLAISREMRIDLDKFAFKA